jgi:UDP-N-acetylglucosamine--N-acetylmuramyl-(pentapeptide) pyrophosphoryl-undecaprenol N-acetylglucosamine transferase
MKKIVLTGGGTAGHVTPNLALLPRFKELNYEVSYIGSYDGIEKKLVSDFDLPYCGIATGKLRRYFSLKNFTDPFRIIKGYFQARRYLKKVRPDLVFSKGGFVAVPVVRAAHSLKIPCIIHESDMTPGLANKLCIPVAKKVCCNFPETMAYLPKDKAVLSGSPIREEIKTGDANKGKAFCGFTSDLPVLLVMGGSLGAAAVNKAVRDSLDELLKKFQIVHLCGKGKLDISLENIEGYKQFEYVKDELKDIFALTDLIISRAGANAICEFLALRKPNMLIPLPSAGSRGDQLVNAKSFEKQGFSIVVDESDLTKELLVEKVDELYTKKETYIHNMNQSETSDAIDIISALIKEIAK